MKYMLMSYETKEDFAARTDEQRKDRYWPEWKAYFGAMQNAGVLAYPGNVLQPGNAAFTVRRSGGLTSQAQGPYADAAAEQLSGYWIIDVPGIEEAIEWADRAPATASGAVEVRPVW